VPKEWEHFGDMWSPWRCYTLSYVADGANLKQLKQNIRIPYSLLLMVEGFFQINTLEQETFLQIV
jgi:hypothetical protein